MKDMMKEVKYFSILIINIRKMEKYFFGKT